MLAITDADRALAVDLGLLLQELPATDRDRHEAERLGAVRMPETWIVRTITRRAVGRLQFTTVDCLYVHKFENGLSASAIEETVADALRWIAPVVRHARTGACDGTEVVTYPHLAKSSERPRAITVCGAPATCADLDLVAAKSELINGREEDMCPACRAKLATAGLSNRRGSASAKQRAYVRALVNEAARAGRPRLIDPRAIDQMSVRQASAAIDGLRTLKARGWGVEVVKTVMGSSVPGSRAPQVRERRSLGDPLPGLPRRGLARATSRHAARSGGRS